MSEIPRLFLIDTTAILVLTAGFLDVNPEREQDLHADAGDGGRKSRSNKRFCADKDQKQQ
jgi:hypothetical protein